MAIRPLFWLVHSAWRYRAEVFAMLKLVAEVRRTARDFTREYLRKRVREGLASGLVLVLFQITLLLGALLWVIARPSLLVRMGASALLWGITIWNLYRFFLVTVPELKAVWRILRGKSGFALRYFLRISIVTELIQWNLILPAICLAVAILTRSAIGSSVSYFAPWVEALRLP